MMKIAVLDDYQNVALKSADWSPVAERAEITAFNDHLSDPLALVERLLPFDVICVMRERTPLTRSIIQQLPQPTERVDRCGGRKRAGNRRYRDQVLVNAND
jgi:hypothetical protein